jgi:DNA-binding MarR family transcriptional regulator
MKIEEEIQQDIFKSEYQKAGINILFTANSMNLKSFQILKRFGLTLPQFNILRILRGQHPQSTTINSLINRMLDKASNASRIVEKLKDKKLVVRTINEFDRRSVDVKITETGLNLLAQIDLVDDEFYFGTDTLSQVEVIMLNHLLDKGRKSIKHNP